MDKLAVMPFSSLILTPLLVDNLKSITFHPPGKLLVVIGVMCGELETLLGVTIATKPDLKALSRSAKRER